MAEPLKRHHSLPAIHPGQFLKLDLMHLENMSAATLAKAMGVSRAQVHRVIQDENPSSMTADFATRLVLAVGVGADFWMTLQMQYDLWKARQNMPKGVVSARELMAA